MNLTPIARFCSPFAGKFGIPKQSGVVQRLRGQVVFDKQYSHADYVRGIEEYDYLWLLWGFSANRQAAVSPVVRPPRLGGNDRVGVFATRSPYRPNAIGLSSVRLIGVEGPSSGALVLHVAGADLMDGTPIYDIKPYVEYTDSHAGVRNGFVDDNPWRQLHVEMAEDVARMLTDDERATIIEVLRQDPRPRYQHQPDRIYGMSYAGYNVRFSIDDAQDVLTVVEIEEGDR